ncbi:hypothetical protein [Flavobacteriaceae bacterium 14752]|uniref:hypothetical protein n=1 Tax=Mesohalobacter salilacus TaxID=2491711 RepID=UPI000F6370A2|nr:hypothetical protein EIG84_10125 [Flavobacteriaceae bacterium 14752]
MKYIIFFIFLIVAFKGFSQSVLEKKPLTTYSFDKTENPIFKQDSLVINKSEKKINSEIFKQFGENADYYLYAYSNSVFNRSSKKLSHIYQWMSPLSIYFDKSIPKSLKKSLTSLVEQIEEQDIRNLSISFVKDKDDANYLIKPTNKTFNVNFNFKNEEERKAYVYNNGRYKLMIGSAKKPRGCILEMNFNNGLPLEVMKKNLNQLFFLSLGRFRVFKNFEYQHSFINASYQYSEKLDEFDIAMIKIHYNVIFNSPLTKKKFKEITKFDSQ